MPLEIAKQYEEMCRNGTLPARWREFKERRGLSCTQLGEAVASIVENMAMMFQKIPDSLAVGALGLKPEAAIKYFESKGFAITWDWRAQITLNNAQAFTVAKAMKMDVLMDIRGMVNNALNEGTTFQTFKKELKPMLQARGWWGKKEVTGPDGRKVVQLGSPHRLKTIYETNTQSAYNAGRWRAQEANKENRPFLKYVAVMDAATREEHAAMNDTVKPVDSPFWNTYYPPNDFNCFSIQSLVVTPSGLRPIESIKEGDVVIGGSGKPKAVITTFARAFKGKTC